MQTMSDENRSRSVAQSTVPSTTQLHDFPCMPDDLTVMHKFQEVMDTDVSQAITVKSSGIQGKSCN
jgi:hypothetical protein